MGQLVYRLRHGERRDPEEDLRRDGLHHVRRHRRPLRVGQLRRARLVVGGLYNLEMRGGTDETYGFPFNRP
jgi:hypothetical protein